MPEEGNTTRGARSSTRDRAETVRPRDRATWRRWLERHHGRPTGVWLLIRKKGGSKPGITVEEAQEEALCFGWIDSTANPVDHDHFTIWMAPRQPTSGWSRVNKERVKRLIADGLMTEAGLDAIRVAKGNGAWETFDAIERMEVPEDLAAAFAANPTALANYEGFPPSARKLILYRIAQAKRPETRARRIEEAVGMAEANLRAGQDRAPEPHVPPDPG